MMEGGDDGVVGEINLYPGEVRREEGMTSHTFWSDSQNSINISSLLAMLIIIANRKV